jgi:hypothetical protein
MRCSPTILAAGCASRGDRTHSSRLGPVSSSSQPAASEPGTGLDPTVGVELVSLVLADAERARQSPDEWISVQVLALASVLLPCRAMPFALPTADVPTSMFEAALALLGREDRSAADRLAEAAAQMLARHLVDSYLAVPLQPGGRWTLRDWLVMADLPAVVAELQAAAWFNRLRLLADEFGTDVLADAAWSGAVAAARDHPFSAGGALRPGG